MGATGQYDVILVGGGLASGLLAWALSFRRPDVNFLVIESRPEIGGNHTWSFHPSDVGLNAGHWLSPLISRAWTQHEVRFPEHMRRLSSGYCSIRSIDFHRKLLERLSDRIRTGAQATQVETNQVTLSNGENLRAGCVLDGRGTYAWPGRLGYQKFLGQFVTLEVPHGLTRPILMDATVEQRDGYRFVYTLPWDETTLLIEDTYYSESPTLDSAALRDRIRAYCDDHGWRVSRVDHEENGVLPIPITAHLPTNRTSVATIGLSGGFFNPTTGFSLPDAVRVVDRLIAQSLPERWPSVIQALQTDCWRRGRYFRLLNRALFWGTDDTDRYRILQRFYRLPEPLIRSFYRGDLSVLESLRIVLGRPPVPVLTLARNLWERGANDPSRH